MNLDRFAYGLRDPQEISPIAECRICGDAIFPGAWVGWIGNGMMAASITCQDCAPLDCPLWPVEDALEVAGA